MAATPSRGTRAVLLAILALTGEPLRAQFAAPVDLTTPRGGFREAETFDADGNGDPDLVAVASDGFNGASVAWYPNDGSGNFGTPVPISALGVDDLEIADANGDGHADIVFAYATTGRIGYWPGNGSGAFGGAVTVADTLTGTRKATPFDLDGDGDTDLLTLFDEPGIFDTQSGVAWYENDGSGGFAGHELYRGAVVQDPHDIAAGDLDGNGTIDLVLACLNGDKVIWLPGTGGTAFGTATVIPSTLVGCRDLELGDIDADGDLDIAITGVGDFRIAVLRNTGGAAGFVQQRLSTINSSVDDAQDLELVDLDGDGRLDVAGALIDENAVDVVRNLGAGNWAAPLRLQGPAFQGYAVTSGDYDGDGLVDLASGSLNDSKLAWYRNLGGFAFGEDRPVNAGAGGVGDLAHADLDGDGRPDLLHAAGLDATVAWYRNTGTGFAPRVLMDPDLAGASTLAAGDLDADGDADVVAAGNDAVRLYVNDGSGGFSATGLTGAVDQVRDLALADLDGDGRPDVVITSWFDSKLAWYRNLGGGAFAAQALIGSVGGADGLAVADFDGDGDPDIAAGEEFNDWIVHYENLGGAAFAPETTIASGLNGIFHLSAGDVTGNGLPDVLYAAFFANRVGFVPATPGGFGARVDLPGAAFGPQGVRAWDPDGDGDRDIVVSLFSENRTVVYPNTGGGVFAGKATLFDAFEYHRVAEPFDADGDGDADLAIGFKNTVTYLENERLSGGCSSAAAPTGLSATVSGGALLSWTAVPGSVACQVRGKPVSAPAYATLPPVFGTAAASANVPAGALTPGTSYDWQVRCACTVSPPDLTPWSVTDTFTVPLARMAETPVHGTIVPNPAVHHATLPGLAPEAVLLLHDAAGRLRHQAPPGERTLDLGGLPAGLYRVTERGPSGERHDHGWLRVAGSAPPR